MSPSLKMRHGVFAVVCGLLLTFQNCAQPPEQNSNISSFADKIPIAADINLDTISYMSCSNIKDAVEKRAYFTIRAGAYGPGTSGLALRTDFREATKYYSATDRARQFSSSAANSDTLVNLSIRSASNYQSPWVTDDLRAGEDIDSFLPPLDSGFIAGPLSASAPGSMINYFPGAGSKRLVEASLRFYKDEVNMVKTRQKLETTSGTDAAFLIAGFSAASDELNLGLRSPYVAAGTTPVPGSVAPVYGRGFVFAFAQPLGYAGNSDRRVISATNGLREFDMSVWPPREVYSNWDCSTGYQFMVIRPEDIVNGRAVCARVPDRAPAGQEGQLAAIRRVLRVEDWFVDMSRHCIVPKRTGDYCYGDPAVLANRLISYGTTSCVNDATTVCPHFVSVCIRR